MSTKSSATRARILAAALDLFNTQGTAAVSTNHVAAAAGISPGNLYYHYADKRDIIRGLLAELIAAYEQPWYEADDPREALIGLRQSLTLGAEVAWRYRFFGRERLALLRADAELAATYSAVYQHRLAQWSAVADRLVADGLLRPPRSLPDLVIAIWLVAENWVPFLDLTGDANDPDQVVRQADLVTAIVEPHLTTKARRIWQEVFRDRRIEKPE